MIQISTLLKIVDNSGARFLYCIRVPHGCSRLGAPSGSVIKGSVRKLITKKNVKKSRVLKLGQICMALIVRTVYGFKRWVPFILFPVRMLLLLLISTFYLLVHAFLGLFFVKFVASSSLKLSQNLKSLFKIFFI